MTDAFHYYLKFHVLTAVSVMHPPSPNLSQGHQKDTQILCSTCIHGLSAHWMPVNCTGVYAFSSLQRLCSFQLLLASFLQTFLQSILYADTYFNEKKVLRVTQILRAGCSKAESKILPHPSPIDAQSPLSPHPSPHRHTESTLAVVRHRQKNFAPPQTPFLGAHNGQYLISWRWSLPSPTDPVWCRSMHTILSYHGNRHTHKPTDRTDYNTLHR